MIKRVMVMVKESDYPCVPLPFHADGSDNEWYAQWIGMMEWQQAAMPNVEYAERWSYEAWRKSQHDKSRKVAD